MDFFTKLFDTSDFPPRWHCGLWTPGHGWLHILSDLGVWSAYVAIPCVLGYFVLRKKDVPFRTVFLLFGAFILACGTTHLMEAIIFWWPAYRLAGLIKLFTAVVSWATVIALVPIVPRALAMRSPEELEREIAERKRAEEAARLASARLELAVSGSNIGVWEIDMPDGVFRNGRVDYTNVWELLGYDRPKLSSDFAARMTLVHPDDQQRLERDFQTYLSGQSKEFEVEHRARNKDGSYRWMLTRGVAMRDPAGKPIRMIGISIDITDHKRTEEELRTSEERFRRYFDLGLVGMAITSPTTECIEVNDEICKILGYDRNELLKKSWPEMTHPDDAAVELAQFNRVMVGEIDGYSLDKRWIRKDGMVVDSLISVKCLRGADGAVDYFVALLQDVTERKRADAALRESEGRFRGTFENAAVGIAHKDAGGRILRVNDKYCAIVGYTREELLARSFRDITHPEDLAAELEQYDALWRGAIPSYSLEKRYLRKDGSPVWIDLSVSLQRDAAGKPEYAIAILQDISERKRLDRELRQAKEAAESANRAKDEFLANVSHEIRTPMNAILGMTDLALDTPLTDDQRDYLTTVKSAADNLLGVINDLLDFSKIEAGKLELDPADFSLRESLGDTLRAVAVRAHKKGLELVCHVQPDVPDALVGDAVRLRQALLNLIDNAIKFTERGEVVLNVSVVDGGRWMVDGKDEGGTSSPSTIHDPPSTILRFEVQDTGIGIPRDKQDKIFRAFEQEDTSTTRKYGGTGLGLTIAARLAALMEGQITVESEPGRGSTFAFTGRFRRRPDAPAQAAARPPVRLHDLPVLVVDDNATNRRILVEWLRGWDMKPTAVGDGVAAMDALWHGTSCGQPYALVLLDAHMPGTDGLALAAQIRQRTELSATRIVLLTSGVRLGSHAQLRALHLDAHLLKPVQQHELLETINRVMSRPPEEVGNRPQAAGNQTATLTSSRSFRILVAEDNEFNTRHLERLLVRQGHRVRLAGNGREALAMLGIGGQQQKGNSSPTPEFDVLLLDLHMPELDGFQVIQEIREREGDQGGRLPVIALTARSRKEDRERCLAAGMDDFLAKPIRAAELFAAIDRVISAHGGSRPAEPDQTSLLDPETLLATCGGDAQGLRELCADFRTYAPARLAAVRDALRDQDAARLREAAHKFCGLLSAFSTAAGNVASEIEEHAAGGRLDAARPLVDRLEAMTLELIRQVDGLSLEQLRP